MRFIACFQIVGFLLFAAPKASAQNEFKLKPHAIVMPEGGSINGFAIEFQTNRVIFRPPYEWQIRTEAAEKRVTMMPSDRTASLMMQFVPEATGKKPEIPIDKLREKVKVRFEGGKIFEEFVFHGGAGPAQSFDVDRGTNASNKVLSRIAFLPIEGFLVEITMTSLPKDFPTHLHSFANLMGSFTLEPLKPQIPNK
jgi:hypothetical protein